MNFKKITKSVACLVMTLLIVAVMMPLQAFATEQSAQDEDEVCSVDLELELQIRGDDPLDDTTFTFVLEPECEDDPVPASTFTTRSGAGTANFGDIEFTHTGKYYYTIYEQNDGEEDYVYDDTVYSIEVVVTYNNEGEYIANVVAFDDNQSRSKEPEIVFVNEYTHTTTVYGNEPTTKPSDDKTTTKKSSTSNTTDTDDNSKSSQSPNTGDYSNMRQWIAIVCISIIGVVSCVLYLNITKKRDKDKEKS
jgi:pilin isopeptide linkage protein